ncbi:MAG: hypothetical protein ACJ79O_23140 [Myxococcales bacterium]
MRKAAHALAALGVLLGAPCAAFALPNAPASGPARLATQAKPVPPKNEACASVSGPQGAPDPRLREWLRRLIHDVARKEGVDPAALEALAVTETDLRPSIGRACELGPFQVSQSWARVFQLPSVELLWDPRINAIAAARIYKAGLRRWVPRYASAGKNRTLRAAGFRKDKLDPATFAALAYNWGRAPLAFSKSSDLRTVGIPSSSASYAVRFSRALREAKERAEAERGTPPSRSPSPKAGGKRES